MTSGVYSRLRNARQDDDELADLLPKLISGEISVEAAEEQELAAAV
jgi:hypothetical protein